MKASRFGDARRRIGIAFLCMAAAANCSDAAFLEPYRPEPGLFEGRNPAILPLDWISVPWDHQGAAARAGRAAGLEQRRPTSGREVERLEALPNSRSREQWLLCGILLSTLLLAIALGQTTRIPCFSATAG
jgi:hypothetical protein